MSANRGRLLFGYFFLARQEKVTNCRCASDHGERSFVRRRGAAAARNTVNPGLCVRSRTPSFADRVAAAHLHQEDLCGQFGLVQST